MASEGWSVAEANAILDDKLADYPWLQWHTDRPGAAGTANAATETTRKQITWNSAADGTATNNGDVTWTTVAASEDWTHFSLWSLESGGTFGFSGTVTADPVVEGNDAVLKSGQLSVSLNTATT